MGDYVDGVSRSGGSVHNVHSVNVSKDVDIDAIAAAVAKAIGGMPSFRRGHSGEELEDGFDNTKSLENIAEAMIVQRGKNESNFEDLGSVKKTKKDKKDVDKTIDLLSKLGD